MKKISIFLIVLLFFGTNLLAQKIYIRGGLGIAVSTATSYIYDYNTQAGSATALTSHKGGIGTGLPFVIAGGYKINNHFGFELGVDYFTGFSLESKETYGGSPGGGYNRDTKWHGQMLSIVPAFVMSLPLDKLKPYARIGLKLGVLNNVISREHDVINMTSRTDDIQSKSKDYGGIAIGAQAAIGTSFVLSDQIGRAHV